MQRGVGPYREESLWHAAEYGTAIDYVVAVLINRSSGCGNRRRATIVHRQHDRALRTPAMTDRVYIKSRDSMLRHDRHNVGHIEVLRAAEIVTEDCHWPPVSRLWPGREYQVEVDFIGSQDRGNTRQRADGWNQHVGVQIIRRRVAPVRELSNRARCQAESKRVVSLEGGQRWGHVLVLNIPRDARDVRSIE